MDLKKLATQFPAEDVEWRIGRSGKSGDKVWAMALAYITNRAIMERLDTVCGIQIWRNHFGNAPESGVLCGIEILCPHGEWVTKWDGAEQTKFESVKGGLSGSMKRAGSQWGIGRYLYNLTETFVETSLQKKQGWNYQSKSKDGNTPAFYWKTPKLPGWALPEGTPQGKVAPKPKVPDPISKVGTKKSSDFEAEIDQQGDINELRAWRSSSGVEIAATLTPGEKTKLTKYYKQVCEILIKAKKPVPGELPGDRPEDREEPPPAGAGGF